MSAPIIPGRPGINAAGIAFGQVTGDCRQHLIQRQVNVCVGDFPEDVRVRYVFHFGSGLARSGHYGIRFTHQEEEHWSENTVHTALDQRVRASVQQRADHGSTLGNHPQPLRKS